MIATSHDSSIRPAYVLPLSLEPIPSFPAELIAPAPKYPPHAMSIWKALGWTVVLFLVGYFTPGFIAGVLQGAFGIPMAKTLMPLMLGGTVLGVVTGLLVLRWRLGKGWLAEVGLNRLPIVPTLLALACVPGLKLLCGGISALLALLLTEKDPAIGFVQNTANSWPWWFSLLSVAVAPALIEELWFRGVIGRSMVSRYGVLVGILLASLLFGAFHMSLIQGTYAFALGVAVHLMYRATRSLWVPILVHFAFNALAIGVVLLSQATGFETMAFEEASPTIILTIFAIVVVSVLSFPVAAWGLYGLRERTPETAT